MYEMPQTKKTNYTKLTRNTKLKTQETIQILAPTKSKSKSNSSSRNSNSFNNNNNNNNNNQNFIEKENSNVTCISQEKIVPIKSTSSLIITIKILKMKIFHFRQYCIMYTTFDEPRIWGVQNVFKNSEYSLELLL